jgi:asparagine synthetase B (glutamine-hydrolysing)
VLSGEKVQVDIDSLNVQSFMDQSFYRGIPSFNSPVEAAEALWCEYAASNAALIRSNKKHGQCISGGFDTRLVALALKSKGGSVASVTFGEHGNAEVEIARCIARYMDSDHAVMAPKNEWVKDENWYERLFRSVESVNFPYMVSAATVLQAAGAQSITTGFGGETILGGQSFSVLGAEWDASARLKAGVCRSLGINSQLGRVLLSRDSSKAVSYIQRYVEKSIDRISYILSDDVKSTIDYAKTESARDVQVLIGEYDYMDTTFGQILERFWFAHHVARHFGGQERTANLNLDVVLPIASRRFSLLCSVVRPDWKMDHGVYLKIVKQYFPKEFHLRTANIPIKLTNPELLLWMARAIRAKRDSFVSRSAIRNGELLAIKRDGWSNFESWVRSGSFLAWYPSAFSSGYFDQSAVENKIKRIAEMKEKIFSAQDLLTMLNVEYLTRL